MTPVYFIDRQFVSEAHCLVALHAGLLLTPFPAPWVCYDTLAYRDWTAVSTLPYRNKLPTFSADNMNC